MRLILLFFTISTLFAELIETTHTIELADGPFSYKSVVFSKEGEISYIAYLKEGDHRPITFAFNGGPGSSSIWLHMGSFGPRRIVNPEEGQPTLPPYQIVDNPETLLDLTDLVFIDPTGTGLTQLPSEEKQKEVFSVKGDIESIGNFMRDYLTTHKRWNSPKYVAGESYGAFRASGLATYLIDQYGILLNGLLLISPVIDYQTVVFHPDNQLPYFLFLPTYATTAWYHHQKEGSIHEIAQKSKDFAYHEYAPALLSPKKMELLYDKLAGWTSLSIEYVERKKGKIEEGLFAAEFFGKKRQYVGRFDSRVIGFIPSPEGSICSIYSSAFHAYLHKELGCPNSYTIFSSPAFENWRFDGLGWGYSSLMNSLRNALKSNLNMKLFVGCGYFDLATPFAATEYCIDHLDVPGASIQMGYYEGGHMYYTNPKARAQFKSDLIKFYGN